MRHVLLHPALMTFVPDWPRRGEHVLGFSITDMVRGRRPSCP
jgi:hypothetical protein